MEIGEETTKREELGRMNVADRVRSLVPDLESNSRFRLYEESTGCGTMDVAGEIAQETENSEDLLRAQIVYRDSYDGVTTDTVYVIGHGRINANMSKEPALIFLKKHVGRQERRSDYVDAVTFRAMNSFDVLE